MTSSSERNTGTAELGKDPVPLKGVDLSFLHAPPAGPPPPPAAQQPAPPEPEAAPTGMSSGVENPADPGAQSPRDTSGESGEDLEKVKPIIAYVPVKLRDRLKKTATTTGRSYTDVLFDAVDELDSRLQEVFAEHLAAAPENSLFSRRSRRATTSKSVGGPPVQVPFRPIPSDLSVLDERAATYAAGNRSEFIRIILQTYLK